MVKRIRKKFKKGAASFYIVAFATLILVIVVMSFATIMISEMARTSNDDLAQSAYDSALAGIEDAKLAYYNYEACKEKGVSGRRPDQDSSGVDCSSIVYYVDGSEEEGDNEKDCDMVAKILGRDYSNDGVLIQESTGKNNNMQQAYTCVTIEPILSDYRSTLSENNTTQVVRVRLANVSASEIKKVKLSWYSKANDELSGYHYNNFSNGVTFPPLKGGAQAAAPPTISVGLVQTADSFKLSDFDRTSGGATNRGTVYLVPTGDSDRAKGSEENNYTGVYNEQKNIISSSQIVKSNDRTVKNLPFAVFCPEGGNEEFACSVELELPSPIGGERNDETFAFVVTLPYGQPDTDFAMEFYCGEGGCGKVEGETSGNDSLAQLRGMQLKVDSTGRANNLYRRIEARLEAEDTFFPYPLYAIELLGDDNKGTDPLLKKNLTVTSENSDPWFLGEDGNWGNV